MEVADQATDALCRQAGVIRVGTLEELLEVAEVLASQPLPAGRRVAVVGNAGGCAVLTADACESYGLEVPLLAAATQERLAGWVSEGSLIGNPVELVASATPEEYRHVLQVLLEDEGVDVVIVTCTPPRLAGAEEVARAVVEAASAGAKPVLANFILSEGTLRALREGAGRVPWFAYPESAARAVARIAPYAEWVSRPEGSVPVFGDVDVSRAREILESALSAEAASGAGPGASAGPVPCRSPVTVRRSRPRLRSGWTPSRPSSSCRPTGSRFFPAYRPRRPPRPAGPPVASVSRSP